MRRTLLPKFATAMTAVLLAAVGTYWALLLFAPKSPPLPPIVGGNPVVVAPQDVSSASRLFGAATTPANINVTVIGLIADHSGHRGSAVLSVDGKPGQAYP